MGDAKVDTNAKFDCLALLRCVKRARVVVVVLVVWTAEAPRKPTLIMLGSYLNMVNPPAQTQLGWIG